MQPTDAPESVAPARALVSASNMWRRFTCPGSAAAEAGMPDIPSPYSAEGTLLHHFDANPQLSRDDLTDSQIFVLNKAAQLREQSLAAFFADNNIPPSARRREFVEQEYWLCGEDGVPVEPGVPGHPDRVIYFPDYQAAYIFDAKFGRLPVPKADINLQLRTYAVMFSEHFDVSLTVVAITQPWMKAPDDFHAATYDRDAIVAAKKELLAVVAGVQKPNAIRRASKEACSYCRAKGVCKEALTIAADLAILKISSLPVDELEALGDKIKIAAGVIEAWTARMKQLAAEGKTKLYELGKAANDRFFSDPKRVFDILVAENLLDRDKEAAFEQFLSVSNPSVSKLEKMLHAARKKADRKTSEAKTKEWMAGLLGDLIQIKPKAAPLKLKGDTAPEEEQ